MKYGTFLRLSDISLAKNEFAALKNRGFDCCHLVYKPEIYTNEDALIIAEAAKTAGIEISALFAGFKDSFTKWNISTDYLDAGINSEKYGKGRTEYLKEAAKFSKTAGIKNILIHAGFVANNPYSEDYKKMVELVRDFALFCKEQSINLLLETGGESPVTLLRLIKDVDTGNLFANLDTANIIMYGYGNSADAVYTIAPYIKSVHLKDGLPPYTPESLGKEVDFGTGFADFPKIFALLYKNNFKGPFIIEREIPDGKQLEKVNETLKIIKDLWQKTKDNASHKVISCIGDSLTEGDYGVYRKRGIANVKPENYPYFMSRLLDCEVRNFGKCGATASDILKRYRDGLIDVKGSDIVVIMLGTNGGNTPHADTQCNKDYIEIINLIKRDAKNAKIVLLTPPHATVNPEMSNCGYAQNVEYAGEFAKHTANELSLGIIDVGASDQFNDQNEDVMQTNDGLHFTEIGYKTLAEIVSSGLKKLYPKFF